MDRALWCPVANGIHKMVGKTPMLEVAIRQRNYDNQHCGCQHNGLQT